MLLIVQCNIYKQIVKNTIRQFYLLGRRNHTSNNQEIYLGIGILTSHITPQYDDDDDKQGESAKWVHCTYRLLVRLYKTSLIVFREVFLEYYIYRQTLLKIWSPGNCFPLYASIDVNQIHKVQSPLKNYDSNLTIQYQQIMMFL